MYQVVYYSVSLQFRCFNANIKKKSSECETWQYICKTNVYHLICLKLVFYLVLIYIYLLLSGSLRTNKDPYVPLSMHKQIKFIFLTFYLHLNR